MPRTPHEFRAPAEEAARQLLRGADPAPEPPAPPHEPTAPPPDAPPLGAALFAAPGEPLSQTFGFRLSPDEKEALDTLKLQYGLRIGRRVDTRELLLAALAALAERIEWAPPEKTSLPDEGDPPCPPNTPDTQHPHSGEGTQ